VGNSGKYSHVIWDWNGTLLNDAEWCVSVINTMLGKRGLKTFANIHEYHGVFSFPVIEYYRKIGFDFEREPFADLAVEYIDAYYKGNFDLHINAENVLRQIQNKGINQIILSASEINNLHSQITPFGIAQYFDEILGISDIYAGSKTEIALDFMRAAGIKRALLIGDTEHDFETAQVLGTDCVLIASGHQSRERLLTLGVPVLNEISEIMELL
jgi:phosphoglycolate phosphatase